LKKENGALPVPEVCFSTQGKKRCKQKKKKNELSQLGQKGTGGGGVTYRSDRTIINHQRLEVVWVGK